MKKAVFLSLTAIFFVVLFSCQGKKSKEQANVPVKAIDKKTYKTVKIGNQEWMSENLSVTTFQNGDSIPEVNSVEKWYQMNLPENSARKPAWSFSNNDPVNEAKFGKLYSWDAVSDPRGICPKGFRLPTSKDWIKLVENIEGSEIEARYRIGRKLKSKTDWAENGNGNDSLGFNILPAGYRHQDGETHEMGETACFWASDNVDALWCRVFKVISKTSEVDIVQFNSGTGLSCRCIKE